MENVEDVYPLAPMQEVMLLHAIARRGVDTLVSQFRFELRGALDAERFRSAWQALVVRHAALRTMFLWEDLDRPLQVVRQSVEVPYQLLDWRNLSAEDYQHRLETFCSEDLAEGFVPTRAPLMRISLIQRTEAEFCLVWTTHHLILDRWCIGLLFAELSALLAGADPARDMPPAVAFGSYIKWLNNRSSGLAENYWRAQLGDFREPSLITRGVARDHLPERGQAPDDAPSAHRVFDGQAMARARQFARGSGVTLSVMVQCAWALVVHRHTGRADIVLGAAASGRPPDLPDVEAIIGSFVSNVPARIRLGRNVSVAALLRRVQTDQVMRLPHEHVNQIQIRRWLDYPAERALFDHILVWQSETGDLALPGLEVIGLPGGTKTAYPLTLSVEEAPDRLTLAADLLPGYAAPVPPAALLDDLCGMLETLSAAAPDAMLASLPGLADLPTISKALLEPGTPRRADNVTHAVGEVASAGRERLTDDELRALLRDEWRRVLDADPPSDDADFFESGGDSLSAMSLHANIETATRMKVPTIALFQTPTIDAMARFVGGADWPLDADVVVGFNRGGRRRPLFCIASPEVNTLGYTVAARLLSHDQPVYVLQAPPTEQGLERLSPDDVPVLAADYIARVRQIQANGPYALLGMCTGSHIAVAMARQMETAGEAVAFLGIVNTWANYTVSRRYYVERLLSRLDWYRQRIAGLREMTPEARGRELRAALDNRVAALVGRRTGAEPCGNGWSPDSDHGEPAATLDPAAPEWIDDLGWAHLRDRDRDTPVHARITVFRIAAQPFWRVRDDALGWGRYSRSGASVVALQTRNHLDILRQPFARDFAGRLEAVLAAGDTGHEPCGADTR